MQAAKSWEEGSELVSSYVDLHVNLGWGDMGWINVETSIDRKPAAADDYLHLESAHPHELKRGMARGELCRFLTRCAREEHSEAAWERFRGALVTRGYPGHWLDRARGDWKW